ncbi:hypothetical protein RN001_015679 [Aquatica leii]|uniref:Coiled-coil domain-containing protein R3HCC1L n=1 Tax=Aquatica leii TaxID=1421715 RepID=A0AAN7NTK9_9COLE|nr:hypothetical protein RN001_015679 [Aquatica leii]
MCDDDLDSILSLISTKINKIFCDREFVGCVREDLDIVLKDDKHCVLFPKLKPIFLKVLRYQAFIFDLSVFCIGSGPNQVAVVCKKITKEPTDECPSVSTQKVSKRMDTEENTPKSCTKKSRMRPTQSYYVPPAQRSMTKKGKVKESAAKKTSAKGTSKKSDKTSDELKKEQLHVEGEQIKALDEVTICSESVYSSQVIDSSTISSKSESECFENELSSECNKIELPHTQNERLVYDHDDSGEDTTTNQLSICATLVNENPVVQNLENTCESDCTSDNNFIPDHPTIEDNETNDENFNKVDEATSTEIMKTMIVEEASSVGNSTEDVKIDDIVSSNEDTPNIDFDISSPQIQSDEIVPKESEIETNFSDLYISYNDEMKKKSADCDTDNEKEEMKRALENINRKRRPLIKNMHNDTLWINENKVSTQRTNHTENEKNNVSKENSRINNQEDQNNLANWEDMFDENGDLHAEYIGEIVKQIGCDVTVVKASHDYSAYQNTKYQDLEHVIELYDFPSTFKTQDIMQLYRGASQNPMYVKWCDDTHCLLVLSTPAQAQRALQIEHDIIKARPLGLASSIAATTASSSDLKPAMKRPQTNMQTARRLINTHLGTKSTLSKEEVEQERQALRDAREQRRLERQSEKDAWEGRPRSTKS